MKYNLKNKHALVCGGSQGIGQAIAEKFAQSGALVTILARNKQKLLDVKIKLDKYNKKNNHILVTNLDEPKNLQKLINKHIKAYGVFQILINNSGGPPPGQIIGAKNEEFITTFNRHLISSHIITNQILPGMIKLKYGRIINIISTSVKQPIKNLGVSNTIRGAVASWAKTLSQETGMYGITVNNILPGFTNTDRLKKIIHNNAIKQNKSTTTISKEMQNLVPMKRFGEPIEIANAACFLASEHAGYINGINLPVDGGRLDAL